MNEQDLKTVEQVQQFLVGTQLVAFQILDDKASRSRLKHLLKSGNNGEIVLNGMIFTAHFSHIFTKYAHNPLRQLAERTGFEPATSGVTGRYSNQLNYRSV